MTSYETNKQQSKVIDAAMAMHISTLHDAAFDLLAALLTILLGLSSLIHAVVRFFYGLVGMVVWTFGLWIIFLQWAKAYCIQKSSTSPFRQEANLNE